MDISSLTNLINAFRTETEEEAITPEYLGELLQQIADVLAMTPLQSEVTSLSTSLNNINTSLAKAQTDLTSLKSSLTELSASSSEQTNAIQASLSSLQSSLNNVSYNVTQHDSEILKLESTAQSLQSQIRAIRIQMSTLASIRYTTMVHIETIIKDKKIYIQGASQLLTSGLALVMFRHATRSSRAHADALGQRQKMPTRRGWHRFFISGKAKPDSSDYLLFRCDRMGEDNYLAFSYNPIELFQKEHVIREDGKITKIFMPFGQKSYNILEHAHRFKFAIAFYKPISTSATFQYSDLRTNLSPFCVIVKATLNNDDTSYTISYNFAMA